ncbi:MAG: hypothetical protein WC683_05955 [bacterium]
MRCKCVILEPKPWSCDEHVDAIGWNHCGESIVVECKASRADWQRDYRKQWRRHNSGMGFRRYYMVPEELESMAFDHNGAGVLIVKGRQVIIRTEAACRQDRDWSSEMALLLARIYWAEECEARREDRMKGADHA